VLWQYQPAPGQKTEVQALSVQIPQLQMTGKILLDTGAAREIALLRLGLVSTLLIVLALAAAIFLQQRRRLALEARHSATLEQRVEERTIELRDTQNELVEASNLAALGRFSAGISHELNQPLAAILNFAENGKRYIKMSRAPEAGENLAQIADQVRRITRIIGNLRAFARQEHLPSERIDIVEVMRRTIDMMNGEIKSAGATVKTSLPSHPVYVMAGKVRLEQIVLNLLSNALDAMRTSQQKILSVELAVEDHDVRISVRDTGSGIDEPKRVFEPFYSTKQLGSSKGLGMGLALCFGLVTRFGGRLSCRNLEHGAEFVMTLPVHEAA
jgi:two-component system C4-dicarboxylate transport sensor histidine kinase DctB